MVVQESHQQVISRASWEYLSNLSDNKDTGLNNMLSIVREWFTPGYEERFMQILWPDFNIDTMNKFIEDRVSKVWEFIELLSNLNKGISIEFFEWNNKPSELLKHIESCEIWSNPLTWTLMILPEDVFATLNIWEMISNWDKAWNNDNWSNVDLLCEPFPVLEWNYKRSANPPYYFLNRKDATMTLFISEWFSLNHVAQFVNSINKWPWRGS